MTREKFREVLEDIVADGQRTDEIIRSIKGMVRKADGAMRLVDLNDVIAESISGLYSPTRLGHVAQS